MSADFIVTDRLGSTKALIEAKSRGGGSTRWAREFRKNLFEDAERGSGEFFAIVTPDALYLWRANASLEQDPVEIDIGSALRRYLAQTSLDYRNLSGLTFETVVSSWLRDVVDGIGTEGLPEDFVAAVRNGRVRGESDLDS